MKLNEVYMNKLVKNIFELYMNNAVELDYKISRKEYNILKYHRINLLLPKISYPSLSKEKEKTFRKNLLFFNEMCIITQLFNENSINHVFLKGASLILETYNSFESRRFSDIDILIEENDLTKAEKILLDLGYIYGYENKGRIKQARHDDIIYQRLHTHELHNMAKMVDKQSINIDINFKFSWNGLKPSKLGLNGFGDDIKYIKKCGYTFPVFDNEVQFLHLCLHFYNEAIFFLLDNSYDIGDDPQEIMLFRLLDILLVIKSGVDIEKIYILSQKTMCINKIEYVLYIIYYIMGDKYVKDFLLYFDINEKEIDCIYDKGGRVIKWPINLYQRLYDPESKIEALSYMLK